MANDFNCLKDRCRSPLACGGFGYCRERNFDGCGMDEAQVRRRRQESEREAVRHQRGVGRQLVVVA